MSDKNSDIRSEDVSNLELDILALFYSFSNQYGRVDVIAAADYAFKQYGYIIPRAPFTLTQQHFDILMDRERIYDTRGLMNVIALKSKTDDETPSSL